MANGNMSNQKFFVAKSVAEERYAICKYCPRFTAMKICGICNCIMPLKVKFAKAACPAGKWFAISIADNLLDSVDYEIK